MGVYHRHKIVLFNTLKIYRKNEEGYPSQQTTYPLVKLEITNTSHPFFTGKQKLVDTAGRVDKFMQRYGNRKKK